MYPQTIHGSGRPGASGFGERGAGLLAPVARAGADRPAHRRRRGGRRPRLCECHRAVEAGDRLHVAGQGSGDPWLCIRPPHQMAVERVQALVDLERLLDLADGAAGGHEQPVVGHGQQVEALGLQPSGDVPDAGLGRGEPGPELLGRQPRLVARAGRILLVGQQAREARLVAPPKPHREHHLDAVSLVARPVAGHRPSRHRAGHLCGRGRPGVGRCAPDQGCACDERNQAARDTGRSHRSSIGRRAAPDQSRSGEPALPPTRAASRSAFAPRKASDSSGSAGSAASSA